MMYYRVPPHLISAQKEPLEFHLFYRNLHSGQKNLACAKDDTLDETKVQDMTNRTEKGEELLIVDESLEMFAQMFGGEEEILEANKEQIELKRLQEERAERYRLDYPEEAGLFEGLLKEARTKDSMASLVKAAKAQIENFSLEVSPYFSTMITFCSYTLSRSGELPAGAAFCYFLAKKSGVKDPLDLLEITAAFALRELGYSYLKLGQERREDPDYEKYPMFSQHLLNLAQAPFSTNVSRYILEHRETYLQTGFPRGKGENHTHFHSYIVGATHVFSEIYYQEFKGRELDRALLKASQTEGMYPPLSSTLYGLKR